MAERDDRDGVLQGTKCVQWGRGHPSRSDRGTPPSPTPGQPLQQALSETESWGSLTKKNWWCCRLPLLRRFSIDSLKQNVECGGRTLCLFVFRGSNCWCLPYHHVFCCLHNDSGWEAETKRVAEKKKQQQKKTIQLLDNVLLSHLSKIKNCRHRLERVKLWTIFGDLKYLLGLASIVSRKKKIYICISFVIVS